MREKKNTREEHLEKEDDRRHHVYSVSHYKAEINNESLFCSNDLNKWT